MQVLFYKYKICGKPFQARQKTQEKKKRFKLNYNKMKTFK